MKIGDAEFCGLVNARKRKDIENLPEDRRPTGWAGHVYMRTLAYEETLKELRAKGLIED